MRTPRSPRLSGAAAEELLDGRGPDAPLTWLLAAAAAPGRAEEIAGEAAARAAFSGAGATTAPPVWTPRRAFPPRLFAAKAIALILLAAAGATGGVALAEGASAAHPQAVRPRPPAARAVRPPVVPSAPTSVGQTSTPTPTHPTPTPIPTAPTAAKPCAARSAAASCDQRTTYRDAPSSVVADSSSPHRAFSSREQ